ncbi:MAG: hypothetical protein D6696_02950 [Acidobacteria bacterium]|nr:MAG: hypothetical protein D6696_02950 [Acidobacteriota bacterium]
MARHYYVNCREIPLERVDGTIATKPALTYGAARGHPGDDPAFIPKVDAEPDAPPLPGRHAFERAGWRFRRATDGGFIAQRGLRSVPPRVQANVFRLGDQLLLDTDRLIVDFEERLDARQQDALLRRHGAVAVYRFHLIPTLVLARIPTGADPEALARTLRQEPEVADAEVEMISHIPPRQQRPARPDDPDYGEQWHHFNDGQKGLARADIRSEEAWQLLQQNGAGKGNGVRIAVIDQGFDLKHPDLAPAVHGHSGFFTDDNEGPPAFNCHPEVPCRRHGTFAAGIAVARSNDLGGVGVAYEADLIAVSVLASEVGLQSTIARALCYAADPSSEIDGADPAEGAQVISVSLGPDGKRKWPLCLALRKAIELVTKTRKIPVFWAVANGDAKLEDDEVVSHRCNGAGSSPCVITVGTSDRYDRRYASASGQGLDFLAPGREIASTTPGGGFEVDPRGATSWAAPCAAGVAALMKAANPNLDGPRIRTLMQKSCVKIQGAYAYDPQRGHGRINAEAAVKAALAARAASPSAVSVLTGAAAGVATIPRRRAS